jgi:glycosyltransferase involved in cell wall biosynthesis
MNKRRAVRICHVTSAHPAEDIRIFVKEAVSACKAGYEVHLIAPGERDYVKAGVHIHGIKPAEGGRLTRMWKTVNRVYRKAEWVEADIYHLHDPELLRIALKLKRKGKKVVFDSHEDVPKQIMAKHWIPKIIRLPVARFFGLIEHFVLSRVSGVVAATPFIKARLQKINTACIDINNYPLLEEFPNPGHSDEKTADLCYVGGISESRGIFPILDMLEKAPAGMKLELAGPFSPPELETRVKSHPGFAKVNYRGVLDRTGIAELLKTCRIGLVTLLPTPNHLESQPIKLYEYMAAGLPVIASDFPYWTKIVREAGCGLTVNPEDPEALLHTVKTLLSDEALMAEMGANGRRAIETHFNWQAEERKLMDFYTRILHDPA